MLVFSINSPPLKLHRHKLVFYTDQVGFWWSGENVDIVLKLW